VNLTTVEHGSPGITVQNLHSSWPSFRIWKMDSDTEETDKRLEAAMDVGEACEGANSSTSTSVRRLSSDSCPGLPSEDGSELETTTVEGEQRSLIDLNNLSLEDTAPLVSASSVLLGSSAAGDSLATPAEALSVVLSRGVGGECMTGSEDGLRTGPSAPPAKPMGEQQRGTPGTVGTSESRAPHTGSKPSAVSGRPKNFSTYLESRPEGDPLRTYFTRRKVQKVLYSAQYTGKNKAWTPPYDESLGRYAHDCSVGVEDVENPAHLNLARWVISHNTPSSNVIERRMVRRWENVAYVPGCLGHWKYHPRLLPSVTVPVTMLPWTRVTDRSMEAFFVAWAQAGCRCPVEGCEPMCTAIDPAQRNKLPRPSAVSSFPVGSSTGARWARLESGEVDPASALREASAHTPPKDLQQKFAHWQAYHMKAGATFAVPCCSRKENH
jgi:hypothetical protein